MEPRSNAYVAEVRDYLVGRLEKVHENAPIDRQEATLTPRYLGWWLFESRADPNESDWSEKRFACTQSFPEASVRMDAASISS